VVQRLTAITVIVMVPNMVAGIYGMNFEKIFPPTNWDYGFIVIVGIMALMIVWGFVHSRYLGWL
jgi:magnesium transporter